MNQVENICSKLLTFIDYIKKNLNQGNKIMFQKYVKEGENLVLHDFVFSKIRNNIIIKEISESENPDKINKGEINYDLFFIELINGILYNVRELDFEDFISFITPCNDMIILEDSDGTKINEDGKEEFIKYLENCFKINSEKYSYFLTFLEDLTFKNTPELKTNFLMKYICENKFNVVKFLKEINLQFNQDILNKNLNTKWVNPATIQQVKKIFDEPPNYEDSQESHDLEKKITNYKKFTNNISRMIFNNIINDNKDKINKNLMDDYMKTVDSLNLSDFYKNSLKELFFTNLVKIYLKTGSILLLRIILLPEYANKLKVSYFNIKFKFELDNFSKLYDILQEGDFFTNFKQYQNIYLGLYLNKMKKFNTFYKNVLNDNIFKYDGLVIQLLETCRISKKGLTSLSKYMDKLKDEHHNKIYADNTIEPDFKIKLGFKVNKTLYNELNNYSKYLNIYKICQKYKKPIYGNNLNQKFLKSEVFFSHLLKYNLEDSILDLINNKLNNFAIYVYSKINTLKNNDNSESPKLIFSIINCKINKRNKNNFSMSGLSNYDIDNLNIEVNNENKSCLLNIVGNDIKYHSDKFFIYFK